MQIAVTGGLGRLGRYVVRELAQHAVRVLDIGSAAECHPADLRDLDALRAGLRDIEVVVHLGGIDRSFITDDAQTMQVNAMGTWNLFEASLQVGVRRVIHCSSSSVSDWIPAIRTWRPAICRSTRCIRHARPTPTGSARRAASGSPRRTRGAGWR